jgi:hypothetical protein
VPSSKPAKKWKARQQQWQFWRGSPDLLAHVARAGLLAAGPKGGGQAQCTIDVTVDNAHEVFDSPADFTANVTRNALRTFTSLSIAVSGDELTGVVTLRWLRPWWKPGTSADAEVLLEVRGRRKKAVERLFDAMAAATARGKPLVASTVATTAGFVVGIIAAPAAVVSALFLLTVSSSTSVLAGYAAGFVGAVLGALGGTWVWPSLEVAPVGQTNLWRFVRVSAPILIALVLSGITKLLYG